MARDRKAALAASIQAERNAAQPRIPRFDKFERAEVALSAAETTAAAPPSKQIGTVGTRRGLVRQRLLERVTRDSFTMPSSDYEKIQQLRSHCLKLGVEATKSEILRAGLHALERLTEEELQKVVSSVEKVKPGRPGR
jgi:hypothetical protein